MNGTLNTVPYVEDEPDIHMVAPLALETKGGFTLKVCGSGEETVQAGPGSKADLFLLDVPVPARAGTGTLTAPRAIPFLQELPAVFMTARVRPGEIQHYRSRAHG